MDLSVTEAPDLPEPLTFEVSPSGPRQITLHQFQRDVLDRVMWQMMSGKKVVMQMPTGAGKTRTAARLIQLASANETVWFVCHRREIIRQASKSTLRAFGIPHGVISPEYEADFDAKVQVASIQTLGWRWGKFPEPGLIVWDECHHMAARSWAKLMRNFPNARHVGLTATPERLDGKGLSEHFDELVVGPPIRELIDQGYLSDYRMFVPSEPDLTAARMSMGDYKKDDIAKLMDTPVIIGDALDHYQRLAPGSRALAFAASVEASKHLVAKFAEAGIPAAHVDGKTSTEDRDAAVADLAAGRINLLSNCEVFTEGFDLPAIDTVILLRPTRSLQLYLQMVGRGLRAESGKGVTTILDHAGLYHEHQLPDAQWEWSLEGGARKRRAVAMRARADYARRCPQCSRVHPIAAHCPECGYGYLTGREVGQFDAQLLDVSQVCPPPGCESRGRAARHFGVSPSTISRWLDIGLPTRDGFIDLEPAAAWIEEHGSKTRVGSRTPPAGCVTRFEYAKSIGVGPSVITNWINKKGMPTVGKYIPVKPANFWVHQNWAARDRVSPFTAQAENYEPKDAFAARIQKTKTVVRTLCSIEGFPVTSNGWINWPAALEWIRIHRPHSRRVGGALPGVQYESFASLASLLGVSRNQVRIWSRRSRIGGDGWAPTLELLVWVRDNTNLKIPPEAWPSADPEASSEGA